MNADVPFVLTFSELQCGMTTDRTVGYVKSNKVQNRDLDILTEIRCMYHQWKRFLGVLALQVELNACHLVIDNLWVCDLGRIF